MNSILREPRTGSRPQGKGQSDVQEKEANQKPFPPWKKKIPRFIVKFRTISIQKHPTQGEGEGGGVRRRAVNSENMINTWVNTHTCARHCHSKWTIDYYLS